MNETLKKLPWFTPLIVVFLYILYGWGLAAINSPALHWLMAIAIIIFLNASILSTLLLAVPTTLALAWAVAAPLVLETAALRGNEYIQSLANSFRTGALFFALSLVLSALWFSPLFWYQKQVELKGFNRQQSFWFLTAASWLGLFLGGILGKIY